MTLNWFPIGSQCVPMIFYRLPTEFQGFSITSCWIYFDVLCFCMNPCSVPMVSCVFPIGFVCFSMLADCFLCFSYCFLLIFKCLPMFFYWASFAVQSIPTSSCCFVIMICCWFSSSVFCCFLMCSSGFKLISYCFSMCFCYSLSTSSAFHWFPIGFVFISEAFFWLSMDFSCALVISYCFPFGFLCFPIDSLCFSHWLPRDFRCFLIVFRLFSDYPVTLFCWSLRCSMIFYWLPVDAILCFVMHSLGFQWFTMITYYWFPIDFPCLHVIFYWLQMLSYDFLLVSAAFLAIASWFPMTSFWLPVTSYCFPFDFVFCSYDSPIFSRCFLMSVLGLSNVSDVFRMFLSGFLCFPYAFLFVPMLCHCKHLQQHMI